MNKINKIVSQDIIPKLESISGVNVMDGWIVHYAHKFSEVGKNLDFPAIGLEPVSEQITFNGERTQIIANRTFRLIGAVSTKKPETVTDDLNNLLYDVRKVLVFNVYDNTDGALELGFGKCNFMLPDQGEPYALFELEVQIKYTEQYE